MFWNWMFGEREKPVSIEEKQIYMFQESSGKLLETYLFAYWYVWYFHTMDGPCKLELEVLSFSPVYPVNPM